MKNAIIENMLIAADMLTAADALELDEHVREKAKRLRLGASELIKEDVAAQEELRLLKEAKKHLEKRVDSLYEALGECERISTEVSDFLVDVFGDYDIYKVHDEERACIVDLNKTIREKKKSAEVSIREKKSSDELKWNKLTDDPKSYPQQQVLARKTEQGKLRKVTQNFLVTTAGGEVHMAFYRYDCLEDGKGNFYLRNTDSALNVVAWMPLPKPYSE